MRKMLATAVALGPLLAAQGVWAETVISNKRETPIATATANSGAPDDVKIDTNGSVVVTSGAAVTLNSNNKVTNAGAIRMEASADNSTGILVSSSTGTLLSSGSITVTDDYEAKDDDKDGDIDGAFAEGTGRYGIHIVGPFTGAVTNSGAITVDGNQSYGIAIDGPLTGAFANSGTIKVTGDDSVGISAGDITGKVNIGGTITVQGENAVGVELNGTVTERVTIDGSITSTGYRYTSRPSDDDIEDLDADDLLQGGPAVVIGGDMNKGVLFTKSAPTDEDPDDDDEDDNGVPDDEQGPSAITSYGSSPAILVGSATKAITLGVYGADGLAYGLIVDGNVSADGVYDGVDATAIQVGGLGQTVTVTNGVRITGAVGANAYDADATGLSIGAGATANLIQVNGTVKATVTAHAEDTPGDTSDDFTATAVKIDAAATTTAVVNTGVIQAAVSGNQGSAVGIFDDSGKVAVIQNFRAIVATVTPTDTAEDPNTDPSDEIAVAIDVSKNTTGVIFRQSTDRDGDGIIEDEDRDGDDGKDGKPDPDADGDTIDDNDEPVLIGAVKLGSGADTVSLENGTMRGDVFFGAGDDKLLIKGGGSLTGKILDSDGKLEVSVKKGTLSVQNTSAQTITSLTIGSSTAAATDSSLLVVNINPGGTSGFNVTGAATFDKGAALGASFSNLLPADFDSHRYTIVHADGGVTIAPGVSLDVLETNVPYLFIATADTDANNVYLDARRRTATEAGFIKAEAAAYNAVYAALGEDQALRNAFLAQIDRADFINLYEQLLPDHSAGPLLSLASGVDAVSRAMSDRRPNANYGELTGWVQEINFYADKDKGDSYGFRSEGFGIAAGLERGSRLGALGLSIAYTSSDLKDPEAAGDENLTASLFEFGGYWRAGNEHWTTWARAAVGYGRFKGKREVVGGGLNLEASSDWTGLTAALASGASYEARFGGRYFIRPDVTVEYFYLREDAHKESGDDSIRLDIDERTGHLFTAKAIVSFGARFGDQGWLQPELRLGWRQNISSDGGTTIARFQNGQAFSLVSDDLDGGGPIIGFRILANGQLGFVALEGDAELMDLYSRYSIMLRAGYRF